MILQAPSETLPSTEEAVTWAYRLLLGREPENAQALADHIQQSPNLAILRDRFMQSAEFTSKLPGSVRFPLRGMEPNCRIDCDGDPVQLGKLFAHVNRSWHMLGDEDPFYSVRSAPEYRGAPPEEVIRDFFLSGVSDAQRFFGTLDRNGLNLDKRSTCLEFGCGLGRVTQALAPRFAKTVAVDISASHLALARSFAEQASIAGIDWRQLASIEDLDRLPRVDVIYSIIVLQHNPPPVIDRIVATFARILKPGGIAYFQVPTYVRGYSFDLGEYLDSKIGIPGMEMHVYPQDRVFRRFAEHNAIPVSVVEDDATAMHAFGRSNTFLFVKAGTVAE